MSTPNTPLLPGTLDLVVLQLLKAEPTNGYDLALRIQAVTRDVLSVNAGSLYPALYRLEKRGLVKARWDTSETGRRAKFYRLTSHGREHLTSETARLTEHSEAVLAVLNSQEA